MKTYDYRITVKKVQHKHLLNNVNKSHLKYIVGDEGMSALQTYARKNVLIN